MVYGIFVGHNVTTKMIQGMKNFKYPERLRQLELPTLAYRRKREDMIYVTYKLLSGLYDEQVTLRERKLQGHPWWLPLQAAAERRLD